MIIPPGLSRGMTGQPGRIRLIQPAFIRGSGSLCARGPDGRQSEIGLSGPKLPEGEQNLRLRPLRANFFKAREDLYIQA